MKQNVTLVGNRLAPLVDICLCLNLGSFSTLIAEQPAALQYLLSYPQCSADAVIVILDGTEEAAAIEALLAFMPDTGFIFLAPELPVRPALADAISRQGAAVLRQDEPAVVVAASLISLLSQRRSTPKAPTENRQQRTENR